MSGETHVLTMNDKELAILRSMFEGIKQIPKEVAREFLDLEDKIKHLGEKEPADERRDPEP